MINDPDELLEVEILSNLISNKKYFGEIIPFLKEEYFDETQKRVFRGIKDFYNQYKTQPTLKELVLSYKTKSKQDKEAIKELAPLIKKSEVSYEVLVDNTEKFIKRRIFENAIITGAEALGSNLRNEDDINKSFRLAEEAVRFSIQSDIGIEFDEVQKLDFSEKKGILTGIPSFDKLIGNGFTPKTLHSILAASGVGKSAALVSFLCNFARDRRDIIYLSLEMSEEEIFKRIYANLLRVPISTIPLMDKKVIEKKVKEIYPNLGKIVVKEYPAGGLSPLMIDGYLDKIRIEKGIKNPILMVDYLGIMKSDRMRNADNSYAYYGSIAEELRAVAQKRNIVIFSPLQLNRGAVNNLESSQQNLSESMRIFMSLDSAFIIAQTPEMKDEGKFKISFVKNRMSGKTVSFEIGYNYDYFEFEDKYQSSQKKLNTTDINEQLQELEDEEILGF